MAKALHLGVIGLGPRWHKRYKPALLALRDQFRVSLLCDPVPQRALQEAKALGCRAVGGPTALVENLAVEAVLLLDTPWYRLWPMELACRTGKPVLCAAALEREEAHADRLQRQVQECQLPVLMEMAPRFTPATARLRELLDRQLGAARLLLCDRVLPRRRSRRPRAGSPAHPLGSVGIALVDWCTSFVTGRPVSVRAEKVAAGDFASLLLEYTDGLTIVLRGHRTHEQRGSLHLRVEAEHGTAEVHFPNRVSWTSREGEQAIRLPRARPLSRILLERFYQVVRQGQVPQPSLDDAYRVLRWLRAGATSLVEGRRVALQEAGLESRYLDSDTKT